MDDGLGGGCVVDMVKGGYYDFGLLCTCLTRLSTLLYFRVSMYFDDVILCGCLGGYPTGGRGSSPRALIGRFRAPLTSLEANRNAGG